jgi:transposase
MRFALTPDEKNRLETVVYSGQVSVGKRRTGEAKRKAEERIIRRAKTLLMFSDKRYTIDDIADECACTVQTIYTAVNRYKTAGLDAALNHKIQDSSLVSPEAEQRILALSGTAPSLRKLVAAIIENGIVPAISHETVREILHRHNVTLNAAAAPKKTTRDAYRVSFTGTEREAVESAARKNVLRARILLIFSAETEAHDADPFYKQKTQTQIAAE